jgi:hypothetical protein
MGRFLGDAASDVYAQSASGSNTIQSFIPRSKFQFIVKVTYRNPEAPSGFQVLYLDRIASIGQPSYTTRNNTLNQYNRKRTVQTGVDYNPITLAAYDTRDAQMEKFIKDYTNFYFTGPINSEATSRSFNYDVSMENFTDGSSNHGLRLQKYKYFIWMIEIIKTSSSQDYNVTKLYNPMIQSIATDELNYSDSGPILYNVTFTYEGYNVQTYNSDQAGSL